MTPKDLTAYRLIQGTSQDISVLNGSAVSNTTPLANTSDAPYGVLRVVADLNIRIEIGSNVTATSSSTLLRTNEKEYFVFNKGDRISVYGVGSTGTCNITECSA